MWNEGDPLSYDVFQLHSFKVMEIKLFEHDSRGMC